MILNMAYTDLFFKVGLSFSWLKYDPFPQQYMSQLLYEWGPVDIHTLMIWRRTSYTPSSKLTNYAYKPRCENK